jgi:hypothetical protein
MLPARVPRTHDDTTARAHLRANVQAAAGGDRHPGHWHLHHIALATGMSGDFTPYRAPDYAEEERAAYEQFLEYLAGLLGIERAQGIERRGPEIDREAGA